MKLKKEVSIIELWNGVGPKYKVTKRIPEFGITETRVFRTIEEAKLQLKKWLD